MHTLYLFFLVFTLRIVGVLAGPDVTHAHYQQATFKTLHGNARVTMLFPKSEEDENLQQALSQMQSQEIYDNNNCMENKFVLAVKASVDWCRLFTSIGYIQGWDPKGKCVKRNQWRQSEEYLGPALCYVALEFVTFTESGFPPELKVILEIVDQRGGYSGLPIQVEESRAKSRLVVPGQKPKKNKSLREITLEYTQEKSRQRYSINESPFTKYANPEQVQKHTTYPQISQHHYGSQIEGVASTSQFTDWNPGPSAYTQSGRESEVVSSQNMNDRDFSRDLDGMSTESVYEYYSHFKACDYTKQGVSLLYRNGPSCEGLDQSWLWFEAGGYCYTRYEHSNLPHVDGWCYVIDTMLKRTKWKA